MYAPFPLGSRTSPAKVHDTGTLLTRVSKSPFVILFVLHGFVVGLGVGVVVVDDVVVLIRHVQADETLEAGYCETYVGRGWLGGGCV